jgi:uncharacterized protein (DUF4415 family)
MNPTIPDEIMVLKNMPDSQIDTSDIPEIVDWKQVQVGRFYRKTYTITIQVDSDVLSWLESQNYQNNINDILRHLMLQQLKR